MRMPLRDAPPIAEAIATGVAITNAHGQAITKRMSAR